MIFLSWFIAKRITQPINSLSRAVSSLDPENLHTPIQFTGANKNAEVKALSRAFNQLGEKLDDSYKSLQGLVDHRTQHLQLNLEDMRSFAHSVSHDLKAPLRRISGFANILQNEHGKDLNKDAQDLLGSILRNIEHMDQLIDDLLKLSRVTNHELQCTELSVSALCQKIARGYRHGIEGNAEPAKFIIQENMSCFADPELLRTMMENLIDNAIKFSSMAAQPCIEISAKQEGDSVIIAIKDNGIGFDSHQAKDLFKAFSRLHNHKALCGHGIGLATVKRIVTLHNGQVWAESQIDQGATFFVRLHSASKALIE